MFSYHARLDPTDDFHVVCTHLMGLFYGTDVKVEQMEEDCGYQDGWILVSLTGTKDECIQLRKQIRRLVRGKPRFTISRSVLAEHAKTPVDRLQELIDNTLPHPPQELLDELLDL